VKNSKISNLESRRGMALVIVLAIIVLVLGLCVGFLARVSTERNSSKSYASAVDARLLADTAVQIVQGQIDAATTQGTKVAWSSQPGLIRTYDDSGQPAKSYKLYSSGAMQTAGALNPATEAGALANWFDSPALYTDLNAPVDTRFSGTADCWPILDPSSFVTNGTSPPTPQGFSISGAPTGAYQGVTNPAPMPVNWLYVLKDGQIVAPTGSGNTAAIAGASASNPITGRIAFWTDDETCKVNINTASEGTYWDVPRFMNLIDQKFGIFQPVKNEFQNYPGHPGGISLSSVFPNLVSGTDPATQNDPFYSLAPRIEKGGSLNLTVTATTSLLPVEMDHDRLYANEDELIFNNARLANAGLSQSDIAGAKFFLTAQSRAPETNLFNLPKIACWPVHTATDHRSAFDKLIAFCSAINGLPYYFQRQDKDSTTFDYANIPRNQNLYSYLQTLTGRNVPGFGGTLATKFGADRDQILTEIFDYIRCTNLNDLNVPDPSCQYAGGTTSYLFGQGEVAPITVGGTRGFGRFVTINEAALWIICTADPGTPTSNDPATNLTLAAGTALTKNDGSNPKTKQIRIEAGLILDLFTPMHGAVRMHPDIEILVDGLQDWTVKGNADAADTNFGFPSQARQTYTDAGVFQFGTRSAWVNSMYNMGGYMGANWAMFKRQIRARNSNRLEKDADFSGSSDSSGVMNQQDPFISEPVTVNVTQTNPQLAFSGNCTVTIRQRTTGTVIQTLNLSFPATTSPAPVLSTSKAWTFQARGCGIGVAGGRFTSVPVVKDVNNDVIHSLVAAQGGQTVDPRFIAMTGTVAAGTLFSMHPNADGTHKLAHTIISNPMSGFGGYTAGSVNGNTGTLANLGGKTYPFAYWPCPKVPWPAQAAMDNGDWDNGLGDLADGGFLNEPDQGNIASSYSTPYYTSGNVSDATFTSPSRMMPSPGMFGSLPTGFKRGQGWQTLLFRRQPAHPGYVDSGTASPKGNGGFANAPDYLMMDLFWMPVVEPYAISEPLSTAGKINMNYQILPFTYIGRSTGIWAALKHEKVVSVPTADLSKYKATDTSSATSFDPTANYRRDIKIPETLTQFQQRFDNSDGTGLYAFRTPAEICDIHFIPDDASPGTSNRARLDADMAAYWSAHALTGDNSRERIYTTVYPRLTTKSNTFTVHFRVQALKQPPGSTPGQWVEGRGIIAADYRGSITIERYVDPNNTSIPDYASDPNASPALDSFYHWRVRAHHQFAP